MLAAAVALALLQSAVPAAPAADTALIAAARAASEKFMDRNAAMRAGYRRLGPEIPEMGEHWINPIMIVESVFDPARPPMLTYATIGGKATLTGVGYALAMRPGEAPPPTGVSGQWHDHTATVSAELTDGAHDRHSHGARVVVMHAWVWLENPGGVFADANWALPYIRSGLAVPDTIDPLAARAVALLSGGVAYYTTLLRDLTGEDFSTQLALAAAEVRARPDNPREVWQAAVRAISHRMVDAELRMKAGRMLGVMTEPAH